MKNSQYFILFAVIAIAMFAANVATSKWIDAKAKLDNAG